MQVTRWSKGVNNSSK